MPIYSVPTACGVHASLSGIADGGTLAASREDDKTNRRAILIAQDFDLRPERRQFPEPLLRPARIGWMLMALAATSALSEEHAERFGGRGRVVVVAGGVGRDEIRGQVRTKVEFIGSSCTHFTSLARG